MKESIHQRLQKLADRFEEVGQLLASNEVAGGSPRFRELSMEYARLQPLAERFGQYHALERDLLAKASTAIGQPAARGISRPVQL